jgi:sucrose-6-phosphate hydrolase SacC (GH32 family)
MMLPVGYPIGLSFSAVDGMITTPMRSRKFLFWSGLFICQLLVSGSWSAAAELYKERFRPQFHFTPERNWMNDPNGMVYFEGEYHLFYQYNPFGDKWGHMSWGHAVSPDLVHWEQLPVGLLEEDGVMIFSGSAVVDWKNTSEFGQEGRPPLVAIYTGHRPADGRQNQCLAFSHDRGRTWIKYEGNPVLDIESKNFRDPKVFWHEPTSQWVMVVAWSGDRTIRIYGSRNLKQWEHLSDFGPAGSVHGIWECPDLFPVPIKGEKNTERWVMVVNVGGGAPAGGSGCQYFVGQFDGTRFVEDLGVRPPAQAEYVPEGRMLADFEGEDYQGWEAKGDAFGAGPVGGALGGQQKVTGFKGEGLVNTFRNGDAATGRLTSPEFEITHRHVNFLMGGGAHVGRTCMNLEVDGKVVRTATGDESEHLTWKSWDVSELKGKQARLQIVDEHEEGWGHLNVDQVFLANTPARSEEESALWADYGRDFYAAVSWSDMPVEDGRRIWIGWMSNWNYAQDVPTAPWRSAMSVPRTLTLGMTSRGLRLLQSPVRELHQLRERPRQIRDRGWAEAAAWLKKESAGLERFELIMEVHAGALAQSTRMGLRLRTGPGEETVLACDWAGKRLYLDRTRSGKVDFHRAFPEVHDAFLGLEDGRLRLHLMVDTSSIEVFSGEGETVLTDLILPASGSRGVELFAEEGFDGLRVDSLKLWRLKSIWPR